MTADGWGEGETQSEAVRGDAKKELGRRPISLETSHHRVNRSVRVITGLSTSVVVTRGRNQVRKGGIVGRDWCGW